MIEKKTLMEISAKEQKNVKVHGYIEKEFDMDLMNGILDALRYKYIQNEKLV